MLNTFNCGVGMILIINKENEQTVCQFFKKKNVNFFLLGKIENNFNNLKNVKVRKFGEWRLT